MAIKAYLDGSSMIADLQNAFLNVSAQMQNNMYSQLQNALGQGFLGSQVGLGSVGNQLVTPDELRYKVGIKSLQDTIKSPTKVLKFKNEEWLDSKIAQYRGNLQ